ncbi:calcium:proton antiporter [Variovorax sp. CY25R-8]|uniref:calcium:proton antiporter n=1 Tax=Variovorax sp. CY25R-8 TaxID=2855501 RepID=UPI0021BA9FCA|nr:calcium:proton antiporter [Variovorax sp. CY25R-8]MCT8175155.1 calcium:proton antiporter [Variovorax sp. CY25R-8]
MVHPRSAQPLTAATSSVPPQTWLLLIAAWAVVGAFTVFGAGWLGPSMTPVTAGIAFAALFVTILAASFGVVKEADHLAHALGEPYGTLILTLSIVLIEVVLIASVLLGPGDFPTIGRDSIFAVMMIIMNLVMGLCLIAGHGRNGHQRYNAQGTASYLSMVVLLASIALVLPKYLSGAGEFTRVQAIGISAITAVVYAVFLGLQMRSHRKLYMEPAPGGDADPARHAVGLLPQPARTDTKFLVLRSALLIALILPIVLLAHHLAVVTDYGIAAAGAPTALGGVLIAIIVFTPESITAVKAAMNNEMQRAINLCLGAFVSTVGLTVPAVLVIGLVTGKQVIMGISNTETVLYIATVALGMLSFNGQKTSAVQGWMHLALFAIFGLLLFSP